MERELKCNCCQRDNVRCVVFVNARAELTSICCVCLSQAMKQALKDIGEMGESATED